MTDFAKAREAAIKKALDCGEWVHNDSTMEIMGRYVDAALSALSAAGYVVVPKYPSEAMYDAFMQNANPLVPPSRDLMTWRGDMGNFIGDYQSMITQAQHDMEGK